MLALSMADDCNRISIRTTIWPTLGHVLFLRIKAGKIPEFG
jgi:hypothetical protein